MATEADKQQARTKPAGVPPTEAQQAEQEAARAADRRAAEQRLAEISRKLGIEPHRRSRYGPLVPILRVTNPVSWRELVGRLDEPDESEEAPDDAGREPAR